MPDEIDNGIVIEESPITESSQTQVETAVAVSGLAVEAAIASADEAQQRDEELRTWLEERYNIQLQTLTELQNSQLSTRESLTTILERLSQMTASQQSQTEALQTSVNSIQSAVKQLPPQNRPEIVEVVETTEVEPETEVSQSSDEDADDNLEPSTSQKTRRNTIRKV